MQYIDSRYDVIRNKAKLAAMAELVRLNPKKFKINMQVYYHNRDWIMVELLDLTTALHDTIETVFLKNPYRS